MEIFIIKEEFYKIIVFYKGICFNKYIMGYCYVWREFFCLFKECVLYVKGIDIFFGLMFGLGLINDKKVMFKENRIV